MRDLSGVPIVPPTNWGARAATHQASANAITDAEQRKNWIRDHPVWSEAKPWLEPVKGGNCWYCEAPKGRSFPDVDHFRPKARVTEDPDHPGYWWLAYDWENFRFSCQQCNRPQKVDEITCGKWDRFPLMHGSPRAKIPTDSCQVEHPQLLDPRREGDAAKLTCLDDGTLQAVGEGAEAERAKATIEILYLWDQGLVEERAGARADVERRLSLLVLLKKDIDAGNQAATAKFFQELESLRQRLSYKAPFSRAALCALQSLRVAHPWVETLLVSV